jgi:hypothetical protein
MDDRRKTWLFREVNERIDDLLQHFDAPERAHFLCECPSWRCTRRVELTREEFEAIWSRDELVLAADCRAEPLLRAVTAA